MKAHGSNMLCKILPEKAKNFAFLFLFIDVLLQKDNKLGNYFPTLNI
jgi:hypothetical protein